MRNIFLIATDKPSRFSLNSSGKYHLTNQLHTNSPNFTNQNIYITNDEEIKQGDFFYSVRGVIEKAIINYPKGEHFGKLILTTDQNLIKNGVQPIDDEFLEWIVKNPSCEFVKIEHNYIDWVIDNYKIIIPQEDPKQDPLNLEKLESKLDNALSKETEESLTDWLNNKRDKQEPNFYEKLKEYFENTPREKVLEDWNKSAHLDNVGPTIDEFIENSNEERLKKAAEDSKNYTKETNGYPKMQAFIDGAESDAARDYWYEKFKEQDKNKFSEEDMIAIVEKSRKTGLTAEYLLLTEQFKKK